MMIAARVCATCGLSLILMTPAAGFEYSLKQSNAIASVAQANVAGGNCPGQEAIDTAMADELREAGFVADPYKSTEFEKVWRANAVELYGLLHRSSAELCVALWQRLGPGGSYGRQMLKMRNR